MKLVYSITKWISPNSNRVRHVDNGEGQPLCGGNGNRFSIRFGKTHFTARTWQPDEGEPSCKRCLAILEKQKKQSKCAKVQE